MQNRIKHSTWSGVCMLKANTWLVRPFAIYTIYNIAIFQYVKQNSTFTRQNTLHTIILKLIPYQCIHLYRKYIYKGHFRLSPVSSVGRASDFRSHGCWFESHCEQEFFILHFFAFDALLAGRLVPYKWNQAWHSSDVYRYLVHHMINPWIFIG